MAGCRGLSCIDAELATCSLQFSEESDDDDEGAKHKAAQRKRVSNAALGVSRTDVPVVRRAGATGQRRPPRTESVAGRAASSSVAPPDQRRQIRHGQKISYMDKYVDDDQFLVDADGEPLFDEEGHPLKEDPKYADAVPNRTRASKMPRLAWTDEERIFLYREIQKCPINSKSAFVSEVLHHHGNPLNEGCLQTLVFANSMQIRDQMKDIVKLRNDRDMPILGNARFFLPSTDPRKQDFDEERRAAADERPADQDERDRIFANLRAAALKAQAAKKRKRKDSEEEDDEPEAEADELEQENEDPPAENEEEQDELEIEKEIGDAAGEDEAASGGDNEAAQQQGDEPAQEDAEADNEEVEKEPSPAAPPKRVVRIASPTREFGLLITRFLPGSYDAEMVTRSRRRTELLYVTRGLTTGSAPTGALASSYRTRGER